MAILKFGAPVSGLRGTIGGITFSANGTGPYAKQWSRSVNQKTQVQSVQRSYFSQHKDAWVGLTQAQRDDWVTYAAAPAQELTNSLGEAYFISGFQWFVSLNTRLLAADESLITLAPVSANPTLPATVFFEFDFSAPFFLIDPYMATLDITFDNLVVFVSTAPTQSRLAPPSPQFYMLPTPFVSAPNTHFFVTDPYLIKFGEPAAASRIWFTIYAQDDDGQRSAPLRAVRDFGDSA